jgi:hypothetical protein
MKKLVLFAVLALVVSLGSALAVEKDYRVFLTDGSWLRVDREPEPVDGVARMRLPAGQLVVFPADRVDWEATRKWNERASKAHITTQLPLPRSILIKPVVVAQAGMEGTTAGDPGDRLRDRIQFLDEQVAVLAAERDRHREELARTDDEEAAAKLRAMITVLDDKITAFSSERNGLSIQLANWYE